MTSRVHQVREFLWRSAEAEWDGVIPITTRKKRGFYARAAVRTVTIFQIMGSGHGCRCKFLEKDRRIHGWFACKC